MIEREWVRCCGLLLLTHFYNALQCTITIPHYNPLQYYNTLHTLQYSSMLQYRIHHYNPLQYNSQYTAIHYNMTFPSWTRQQICLLEWKSHCARILSICMPFVFTQPSIYVKIYIVSVLHQDEGGIGKSIPDGRKISRGRSSREILRAEGMDFPIPPEFWWSTDILSASIFLQGVDQEILPCGQGRIDSVKINPSLLMMRE